MRDLVHFIIKASNSQRNFLLPVFIHYEENIPCKDLFLTQIQKYIETNIDFIEATSRQQKSTAATFRDNLSYLNSFEDNSNTMKLSFITKNRNNYYTTIKYEYNESDASFSTSTLLLASFELYLWYIKNEV